MSEIRINLDTSPPAVRFVRMLVSWAAIFGLMGIGVALESTAMQWVGFIMACVAGIFYASRDRKAQVSTIAEARARLDELEGLSRKSAD